MSPNGIVQSNMNWWTGHVCLRYYLIFLWYFLCYFLDTFNFLITFLFISLIYPIMSPNVIVQSNINSWTGHAPMSALPTPNVSFLGPRNFNHLWVFFILPRRSAPRISEIIEDWDWEKTFGKFGLLQCKMLLEVSWINLLGAFFSAGRDAEFHLSDKKTLSRPDFYHEKSDFSLVEGRMLLLNESSQPVLFNQSTCLVWFGREQNVTWSELN